MTLPTSNARPERSLPHRPHIVPPTHSNSISSVPPHVQLPTTPTPSEPGLSEDSQDRALDFASHSWDLATGGLKTLTAKREIPPRIDRRPSEAVLETTRMPRSYMITLVIMVGLVLMLISGGVVLFAMLQP